MNSELNVQMPYVDMSVFCKKSELTQWIEEEIKRKTASERFHVDDWNYDDYE